MTKDACEVNFDGIIGPTYHYGGLGIGNLASMKHKGRISNPKKAALEGLKKMKLLLDFNLVQGVLPPQERPHLGYLLSLGFKGVADAYKKDPYLLSCCASTSSMWAANSVTVTPSSDTQDGRLHISVANLVSSLHRHMEINETYKIFNTLFSDERFFALHSPLFSSTYLRDEGAANHNRFCKEYGKKGVHLFVYGEEAKNSREKKPSRFMGRQTLEASLAIARRHTLVEENTIFAKQNPLLVDDGVFHSDLICVGNQQFFLYHEKAFVQTEKVIGEIEQKLKKVAKTSLIPIKIREKDLSYKEALKTYFFNSQIVTSSENKSVFIAPIEAKSLQLSLPFDETHYSNVHLSMLNGGGPACLRVRVVLNDLEMKHIKGNCLLTPSLYEKLVRWVEKYYRDELTIEDLADPQLVDEVRCALDALTTILGLGKSYYSFQREKE